MSQFSLLCISYSIVRVEVAHTHTTRKAKNLSTTSTTPRLGKVETEFEFCTVSYDNMQRDCLKSIVLVNDVTFFSMLGLNDLVKYVVYN